MKVFPTRIAAVDHLDRRAPDCLLSLKRCCVPLEDAESARLDADDAHARKKRKRCGKNTLPSRIPVMQLHGPKIDLSEEATLVPSLWMLSEDHG